MGARRPREGQERGERSDEKEIGAGRDTGQERGWQQGKIERCIVCEAARRVLTTTLEAPMQVRLRALLPKPRKEGQNVGTRCALHIMR